MAVILLSMINIVSSNYPTTHTLYWRMGRMSSRSHRRVPNTSWQHISLWMSQLLLARLAWLRHVKVHWLFGYYDLTTFQQSSKRQTLNNLLGTGNQSWLHLRSKIRVNDECPRICESDEVITVTSSRNIAVSWGCRDSSICVSIKSSLPCTAFRGVNLGK